MKRGYDCASQINSLPTCRAILKTLTSWSPTRPTANQSQRFYRRTTKSIQTFHPVTSRTTRSRCTAQTDCLRSSRKSQRFKTRTPSFQCQMCTGQTTNPKSGLSLARWHLWIPAWSQNIHPACWRPAHPLRAFHPPWRCPKRTGSRNRRWTRSGSGWTAFSTPRRSILQRLPRHGAV